VQYIDFSYTSFSNLFNVKLKYHEYNIEYYNKHNNLISFNSKQSKLNFKFVRYLKNNYKQNTFYISFFDTFDSNSIVVCFYLNDMICKQGYYDDEKLLASDIIIIVDRFNTFKEIIKLKMHIYNQNPILSKIIKKEFSNQTIKNLESILNKVKNNYKIIDTFYLSEFGKNNLKFILLGKKIKFPFCAIAN